MCTNSCFRPSLKLGYCEKKHIFIGNVLQVYPGLDFSFHQHRGRSFCVTVTRQFSLNAGLKSCDHSWKCDAIGRLFYKVPNKIRVQSCHKQVTLTTHTSLIKQRDTKNVHVTFLFKLNFKVYSGASGYKR